MKVLNKNILLVLVLQIFILLYFYSDVILHANKNLIWVSNDGMKNYYMFIYHIKHYQNIFHHRGFLFPFGDYLFKTDSHPLLTIVFIFLGKLIPSIIDNLIGILNLLMVLSPIPTAIIIFRIFKWNKISNNLAILSSVGISSLSPQFLLLTVGHYAQVYTFFIPLNILILLNFFQENKSKYLVRLSILILIAFLTHMYIGAILIALSFSFLFFALMFRALPIKLIIKTLVYCSIPLGCTLIILMLDTIEGRAYLQPNSYFRASFSNVFLPRYSDFNGIYHIIFNLSHQLKYKWSVVGTYIGLASNIFLLTLVLYTIYSLISKSILHIVDRVGKVNLVFLCSGILILIFSFGVPTIWDKGFTMSIIPFASQIVALERFSYVFYYLITTSTVIFVFRLIQNEKLRKVLILIIAALYIFESFALHQFIASKTPMQQNVFNSSEFNRNYNFDSWGVDIDKYDAILPIPLYMRHYLPEKRESTQSMEEFSMALSYNTGLPIMSVFLSRPSVTNSNILLSFIEDKTQAKVIANYRDKKILVIHTYEFNNNAEISFMKEVTDTVFFNGKILIAELDTNDWLFQETKANKTP